MAAPTDERTVQTTLRLPKSLYESTKNALQERRTHATSLNEFLIWALAAYLKGLRRKEIDAAFAGMAADSEYQKEARHIAEEFATSDWEALELAERHRRKRRVAR